MTDSTPQAVPRARSPSSSPPPGSSNLRKRPRIDRNATTEAVPEQDKQADYPQGTVDMPVGSTTQVQHALPPAALRVIRAVQRATTKLKPIGNCPTVHAARIDMMQKYDDFNQINEEIDSEDEDAIVTAMPKYAQVNEKCFAQLAELVKTNGQNSASGYLDEPFSLCITRPGCQFDGSISPNRTDFKDPYMYRPHEEQALREELHVRLYRWYNNALASGYGDVREQVTKVDESVRTAREIGASEFTVEDELLRRIETIWMERFVPSCAVRAEPYKIHLYGPGGHFKTHRDTPQKDLVGTFLVGLGDTASFGGLVVDGTDMEAQPGSWCAFYPDVPHSVKTLSGGYRATMAFKIFRAHATLEFEDDETMKTIEVRLRIAEIAARMEAPLGLLLAHKYSLGTDEFSGFDALVVGAVRARFSGMGFSVHHLPVVVEAIAKWGDKDGSYRFAMRCNTWVYPFTSGHIDFLNGEGEEKDALYRDGGCAWWEGIKDVPFYSLDLSDRTMFPYKEEQDETATTGNEAQAWRADSVYLSYALVVLPKADKDTPVEVVAGVSA